MLQRDKTWRLPSLLWKLCILSFAIAVATLLWISLDVQSTSVSVAYEQSTFSVLGSKNATYVISLPDRRDRRQEMEKLRLSLGFEWTYFDAFPAGHPVVDLIMGRVTSLRANASKTLGDSTAPALGSNLTWPRDIDELVRSNKHLDLWDATILSSGRPTPLNHPPNLACATRDFDVPQNTTTLPRHLILTPGRVACWHSHLSVIQQFANSNVSDGIDSVFILEDDVDMERDIHRQLGNVWQALPFDWDIIFLGHCWSDESQKPQIFIDPRTALHLTPSDSRLHPSTAPKCTHAYTLSRNGARRLLLYLRYPPFAYSRAIDQAFAWLVETGKLRSYSVVPSLVVQRKISASDVMSGSRGSKWVDTLRDGVLAGLDTA